MTDRFIDAIAGGAEVYDLGRPMFDGMPQSSAHPHYHLTVARRHGDIVRGDGSSGSNEMIVTGGHVGTHIDGLAHISFEGKLHGGIDAAAAVKNGRYAELGMETVDPILCRGVLLDVAGALSVDLLPAAYEITPADLERTLEFSGREIGPGEVILIRTGWARLFDDKQAYESDDLGLPGPGESGAAWLADLRPRAVGSDTIAFECLSPGSSYGLPGHRLLIVDRGIHIIEALDLELLALNRVTEFTFFLSALKLVGATGSPVRPIAVVASNSGRVVTYLPTGS